MLRCVALVRTDVSEELSASFIRATRICELGATLAVTSNRRTLRRNIKFTDSCHPDEGGAKFLRNVGSYKSHAAQHLRRRNSTHDLTRVQNRDTTVKFPATNSPSYGTALIYVVRESGYVCRESIALFVCWQH
jgi:hypothetical protein